MSHPLLINRCMVIATMHKKEEVIRPIVERSLNSTVIVPERLNTDQFGTFTGEIQREHDPLTTAKIKCEESLRLTGMDLAIASEGTFGPHPMVPFIPADTELVLLMDKKNNVTIHAVEISTETNFNSTDFQSYIELEEFARKALFPTHGLILKATGKKETTIKGIQDWKSLREHYDRLKADHENLTVETDMRAMHNPTRMKVIEKATLRLLEKIASVCPSCSMPGFSVTEQLSGLPCELCSMPTRSAKSYIYQCTHCAYRLEKEYPEGKTTEDPVYCNFCNP